MAEPNILNLNDIVDRAHKVRIGKALYDVRNPDEFAVLSGARFKVIGARIEELAKIAKPTEDQVTEFEGLTGEFVRTILVDVPPAVVKNLTSIQRLQTIKYFFQLPGIKAIFKAAAKGAKWAPPVKGRKSRSKP
jgi:hypothetical protein